MPFQRIKDGKVIEQRATQPRTHEQVQADKLKTIEEQIASRAPDNAVIDQTEIIEPDAGE